MDLYLLHGMGRTPASMLLLHRRLRQRGHKARLFGYAPAFESMAQATARLVEVIEKRESDKPYALVGHSLGTVLIRNAVARGNMAQPSACFFLAPPMVACWGARTFSKWWPYKVYNGEMGQLLAQEEFMSQLVTPKNTKIYAGTLGIKGPLSPFGEEPNDCILTLSEATGNFDGEVVEVPTTHTFIMNSPLVVNDISRSLASTIP